MIINLNNKTLEKATLTLNQHDKVMNGRLYKCKIILANSQVMLHNVLDNCPTRDCEIEQRDSLPVEAIKKLANGSNSIAQIAGALGVTHYTIQEFLANKDKGFWTRRVRFKLKQTLPRDIEIAKEAKSCTLTEACIKAGIDQGGFNKRVLKYKEYGLWPSHL